METLYFIHVLSNKASLKQCRSNDSINSGKPVSIALGSLVGWQPCATRHYEPWLGVRNDFTQAFEECLPTHFNTIKFSPPEITSGSSGALGDYVMFTCDN